MRAPPWLSTQHLIGPVSRLGGGGRVAIVDWRCEPIAGGMGDALGVWRVDGTFTVDGDATPFSLILKGWQVPPGGTDPTAWDWPHRERLACASGMLAHLPGGIDAPTGLGEHTAADGSIWAWLSPMSTGALERWKARHFALVARALGRFNGAYLTGEPLPRAPWLSRRWTRQWTESAADVISSIDTWTLQPVIARALTPATVREIHRLWGERHRWFDALDRLPQTFSHLDAFKRNVFLRPAPNGDLRPGLIDWGFAGIAALGEEAVSLVASSAAFGEAPGLTWEQLDATVFAAYLAGLRDAGWSGDERQVRLAFTASLVMRYAVGTLRAGVPMFADPSYRPTIERNFGMPLETILDTTRERYAWTFDLATETRRLLATAPGGA